MSKIASTNPTIHVIETRHFKFNGCLFNLISNSKDIKAVIQAVFNQIDFSIYYMGIAIYAHNPSLFIHHLNLFENDFLLKNINLGEYFLLRHFLIHI